MKRNLLLILLMAMASVTMAQVKVTGRVTNLQSRPVSDVIVKCIGGSKTLAFTTTNSQGVYTLELKETPKSEVVLLYSHISYEKEEVETELRSKVMKQDMMLTPKAISLKEVKVKAPPVTLLGDTLKYNLASFLKKGDVTLEDGLKNLPGVTISDDGAISYMGKGISNFYIGGLDMLGGRYNLATKNIPAQYATQVEIMKHHHHRKIDADEESDNVAINVKLSNKAKFKPFGQPELGVGYRQTPSPSGEGWGEGLLYAAGATEMMFTDNFQLLASAKYSNNGSFGLYDMVNHYGGDNFGSLATDKLSAWGQEYAGGVGESVYRRNGYGSLNAILKLDSVRQFRANADYTYDRMTSSGSSESFYFAGGESIHISESTHPLATAHRPMFNIKFENNASNRYFSDNLSVKAQFLQGENDVYSTSATDGLLAMQRRKATSINLYNNFWSTVRLGKKKISFTSDIGFTRTPSVMMTMNDISQSAQSTQLNTRHSTSLQLKLGSKWKIDMPIALEANYNFIETDLVKPDHYDQSQRMRGWKLVPSINPSTSWTSSDKKFYASMGANIRWLNLSYLSQLDDGRTTLVQLYAEPHASLRYTFSGTSELNLSGGFNHSAGDIMDLLTTPVQTTYRNTSAASGVIGRSQSWSTSLRYSKQVPFSYFTFGANASYNQGKRNVLYSRNVSPTSTQSTSIFRDSHTRSASGGINASKNILSLFTKLSASADVSWGSSEYMMQEEFVTAFHTGYNLHLQADVTPLSWLEVNAKADYGKDWSRTVGTNQSSDNLRCTGSLAVFPIPSLELRSTYHYLHAMVEPSRYKDASMLSASVQYKTKRAVWRLTADNLLDVRQYTRTTFIDTDRFVHTTHLVGRTLMLTCKLLLAGKK
ncbi:MAG: TonB-dependent receptor [Bacteroidales bacterium]|nr:TonB-dependent receptor [Bacteroidales bacterium]